MTIIQLMTGSPNYPYSTEGALAYVESGALLTKITNATINVDVTVGDYVSIVGSPAYSLPIIGSAEVSSIRNALPAGTALLGSVIASPVGYQSIVGSPAYNLPIIGSVEISNSTLNVDVTVSDYVSVVGSPNYSLPIVGSVQVSSVIGALPAGTALLGSIKATPDGYYQMLGSPNYNFPMTGSVSPVKLSVGSILTTIIAGSTFTLLSDADTSRNAFTVTHDNAATLWIGFASPFGFGSGISLSAKSLFGQGYEGYTGSIWGIGSPTNNILAIYMKT